MTSHSYTPEYIQQSISKIYDDYKDFIEVEIRGNDLDGIEVYDFEPNFYDIRPDFLSQIDFSRFPMMKTLKLTSMPSATPFNFDCLLVRETKIEKLIVDFATLSNVYALPTSLSIVEIDCSCSSKVLHLTRFSIGCNSSYSSSKGGFLKPHAVTSEMASFAGWNPEETKSHVDITKAIYQYVKANGLATNENIVPDEKLRDLLKCGNAPLTYLSIQKLIPPLQVKAPVELFPRVFVKSFGV